MFFAQFFETKSAEYNMTEILYSSMSDVRLELLAIGQKVQCLINCAMKVDIFYFSFFLYFFISSPGKATTNALKVNFIMVDVVMISFTDFISDSIHPV